MENKQIMVTSMVKRQISINIPDLGLKRVWEKKGAKKPILFETLQQALYDNGVEYMFSQGMLTIDDKAARIALGLESESEEASASIVVLSDSDMQRYLTTMPIFDFRNKVKELPNEQVLSLVDYAIEHELSPMDKCDILKEMTQIDVIRAIQLKRDNKEG